MYKIFYSAVILSFYITCCAQSTHQLVDSAMANKNINYARSIFWADLAFKKSNSDNDKISAAQSAYLLGVGNYLSGNLDESLVWYFKSESLFKSVSDTSGLILLYSDMCVFYLKLKKFNSADTFISNAINLSRFKKDSNLLASAINNRGLLYLDEGKIDNAIQDFETSNMLYQKLNDKLGMAYALDYLSSAYSEKKLFTKAYTSLEQSKMMRIGLGDKMGEAIAINNIGELYLAQNLPEKALPFFLETVKKSHAINFADLEMNGYKMLSKAYQKIKNFRSAFDAQNNYLILNQKIQDEKRVKTIEELQTKYETDKKQQQIIVLNDQSKIQQLLIGKRNFTIFIIVGIFLFSIFSAWQYYLRNKIKQENNLKNEIAHQQNLAALGIIEAEERERKRIAGDLHDGLGQLISSVKMNTEILVERYLIKNADADNLSVKTISLIDESCREVRSIAHQMMPNVLVKLGLVFALRDLVNNINSDKLRTNIHISGIEERLDPHIETVLYRVIQESINNVIKHAFASVLDISLMCEKKEITVTIEDNGKGFDLDEKNEAIGIGLRNMANRIEFLKGTVDISSAKGKGTLIAIYIPRD